MASTEDTRVIYTAADGNYALQAQVLLASLVRSQKSPTKLVIFGNGWKKKEMARLLSIATDTVVVEVREVDTTRFDTIQLASKFPLATAYNVLAPAYFLGTAGRALYVDADVVVRSDLGDLFATPMTSPVAAVLDAHIGWVSSPSMWRPWREEKMDPLTPYLNTGVLLVDLESWNSADLTARVVGILEKYELPCVDQDAINIVLRGSFDVLPPRYNLMPYHYLKMWRYVDAIVPDSDIADALTDPVIIHFHRSFLGKPWTLGSIHPATSLWRSLADSVHPRWRRELDLEGWIRRRGAQFANMLRLDDRASKISDI